MMRGARSSRSTSGASKGPGPRRACCDGGAGRRDRGLAITRTKFSARQLLPPESGWRTCAGTCLSPFVAACGPRNDAALLAMLRAMENFVAAFQTLVGIHARIRAEGFLVNEGALPAPVPLIAYAFAGEFEWFKRALAEKGIS